MTLPSLKKLRITRLSRQVWTTSLSLAGLVALCLGTADAQRPGQRYLLTFENNRPHVQLLSGKAQPADSSLDRLKERSAQDRFEQLQKAQGAGAAPAPLPQFEQSEPAPVPVVPAAPVENKLPRLPDVEELEQTEPFMKSLQKVHSGTSGRALPPRPVPSPQENKLPRLPDLDDLEEFDPFVGTRQPLQSVPPATQPRRIVRPVPVPVPAPMPAPPLPVNSAFQDSELGQEIPPVSVDVVRSLSDIQPSYGYQFTVKDVYLGESTGTDSTKVPDEAGLPSGVYTERLSPDSLFAWEASNLYHNPLYFEDPTLERYGHVHPCVQPFVSLSRIGVQLAGLPYQSVIDTPHTKRYTLGWYRPGEPAPHLCYQIPLNPEAAAAEAAAITAGFLIIP